MNGFKCFTVAASLAVIGNGAISEPAIIFPLGGKFDKSFGESAFIGAEAWKEESGMNYREFELQSDSQREQIIRRLAEAGNNPVVMAGFGFATPLKAVAPDFPDVRFVIIDGVVDQPNVRSVIYKEHEGSYLIGILATMASKSGMLGFVGGMDIPLIRKFACGYAQGAKWVNEDTEILVSMTGTTGAAWNDPVKGGEIARAQISSGADVILQAAGGTGIGVLQAAADAGVLGIGTDRNQNYLHPGLILTSMVKRVDLAVYEAFSEGKNLSPGIYMSGLADDGIAYTIDEFNAELISDEMKAAANDAREKIISGEIEVHDSSVDGECPAL